MKITGSRCKCGACGEYFNSVGAFDKHRRGKPTERYCDTSKLVKNNAGYWVTGLRDEAPQSQTN